MYTQHLQMCLITLFKEHLGLKCSKYLRTVSLRSNMRRSYKKEKISPFRQNEASFCLDINGQNKFYKWMFRTVLNRVSQTSAAYCQIDQLKETNPLTRD